MNKIIYTDGTACQGTEAKTILVKPVPAPEPRRRAQHNHKIIEALEAELSAIHRNTAYKVLAWLNVMPRPAKRKECK
jgi:hypothetical protein